MIAPDGLACAFVVGAVAALPSLLVCCRVRRRENHKRLKGLCSGRILDDPPSLASVSVARNGPCRLTTQASEAA